MKHLPHGLPRPMACDCCSSPSVQLVENKVLYGKNYGRWPLIWYCPDCEAAVGCHPDTSQPLGKMADRPTRSARKDAHEAFDPLWRQSSTMSRSQAYRWLADELGLSTEECHISMFDSETCQRVVEVCRNYQKGK